MAIDNTAIEYPRDAAGFIIPLDTTIMYKRYQDKFYVNDFFYEAKANKWFARHGAECIETNELYLCVRKEFHYEDDSWSQLLDDLKSARDPIGEPTSCKYLARYKGSCGGYCKFRDEGGASCTSYAFLNIESRIKNLLGDAE